MEEKNEAVQKVKDYLAQLISHDRKPKAICQCINQGKEFVNKSLTAWCSEHGIDVQMTALYSPSQNGVAKRMNRTLVELAWAMMHGLPEILWEYAINCFEIEHILNGECLKTKCLKSQVAHHMRVGF